MTRVELKGGDYTYVASGTTRLEQVFVYDEVGQSPKPLDRIRSAFLPRTRTSSKSRVGMISTS